MIEAAQVDEKMPMTYDHTVEETIKGIYVLKYKYYHKFGHLDITKQYTYKQLKEYCWRKGFNLNTFINKGRIGDVPPDIIITGDHKLKTNGKA